jgi:putative alpha-1,2-mannosidase
LNGQAIDRVWFRHSDIANGGTLELTMGDTPNKSLGSALASFPPASLAMKPEDFR